MSMPSDAPERGRRLAVAVLVLLVAAAASVAALVIWWDDLYGMFAQRDRIVAAIRAAGAWGPLVLVGLIVAQTVVAPIPSQVVNFAAGYLYGLAPGLFYSWLGMVAGTALAMGIARFAGRPVVERLVSRPALERLDRFAGERSLAFFFLVFLIPGLPDDLLCFAAGLTPLPLRLLLPTAAVARVPGLLAAVWLGAGAEQMTWQVWLVSGALGLIGLWVAWRYGGRIQARLLDALARRDAGARGETDRG